MYPGEEPNRMQQLSLFPAEFAAEIVVINRYEILDAWNWLLKNMSSRPSHVSGLCLYDLKLWGNEPKDKPLEPNISVACKLGCLCLTSELGDMDAITNMANGGEAQDIIVPTGSLDVDVRKVIESKRRFRTALSEHLAFWIRLATAARSEEGCSRFACSLPHVQPEDKGPDGLFLSTGEVNQVEVQSVKNSIDNPQSLLSTKQFRSKGLTSASGRGKLLEDLYQFAYKSLGFVRLSRLLSDLCQSLNVPSDQMIRMGLLSNTACLYNAVIVADHQYAEIELFQGYQYVAQNVEHRIATYIGSTSWSEVAEQTRRFVLKKLGRLGLL
jgi:hypothetical protein